MERKIVSLEERRQQRRRAQQPRRQPGLQSGSRLNAREEKTSRKKARAKTRQYGPFDHMTIFLLVMLVCFGLLMVFSASYYVAELQRDESQYYFIKQLFCVAIGTVGALFFMFCDYHNYIELPWRKYPWMKSFARIRPYWVILVIGVISLLLVYAPAPIGVSLNGSRRWINVGVSIQPSEIMKMSLIIFLACSIGRDPRRIRDLKAGLIPYLLLLLGVCAIIYKQPNFSAIVCIVALVMCILMVGGARMPHLATIVAVGVAVLLILVTKADYRDDRIAALSDPMGNWQLKQSLYSIGAGGAFGRGLGNSMQKLLYLPYRESDFIFAIIAEELGFVGCLLVLVMFGLLIWRGVVIAMRAPDLTGMLMATGAVAMIAIQVIVNIGVNVGIIPPTGVVLPFISYGGTGVIIFMSMVGLLLNVSRQAPPVIPAAQPQRPQAGREPAQPQPAQSRAAQGREWGV